MTEDKKYMTMEEAADYIGIKRATLYNYLSALNIKATKFKMDRRSYLAMSDVKRIKQVKEQPWLAGTDEGEA